MTTSASDTIPEQPSRGALALRRATELLSSMRFAIALLTVICIASVIGTVMKQREPVNNYVNQFGPFWADLFLALKLNAVYSAWWFLLILAFLVISTSLCIARHTPKYLADLRNYKENIREQSLQAFHHKAGATLVGEGTEAAAQRIGKLLATGGWKVRLQQRQTPAGEGWMVAAKAGAAHKLGYIAAHSAIVLVCLGGLLDGDLIVRAQMWFGGKTPYSGGGFIADVKPEHRHPEPVRWSAAAGAAVLHRAQEIRGGALLHRHAQAVCQRHRDPRPGHGRDQGRARGGESPGAPQRRGDFPVEL